MFRATNEIFNTLAMLLWNGEWRPEGMGRSMYTLPSQGHGWVGLFCLVFSFWSSSDSSTLIYQTS